MSLDCIKSLSITVSSDVPCDLGIDDNTSFGNVSINPFALGTESSWGVVPIGAYVISYVSGLVEGEVPFIPFNHFWAGNFGQFGTDLPMTRYIKPIVGGPSGPNDMPFCSGQTAQEAGDACAPIATGPFNSSMGEMKLNIRSDFSGFTFVSDAGLPTWKLTRTKKTAVDYNIQVRIVDLPSLLSSLTPFDSCTAGAGTVWDGTFPVFEPALIFANYEYRITTVGNPFQLNGCALDVPAVNKVYHDTAGQATPTGCAWILAVTYLHPVQGNVVSWVGLGGTGYSPLGAFTFSSDVVGWTMFGKKTAVRAATTAALPANTRIVNVLTADANGTLPAIDGVALVVADRVLVKNESLSQNDGVYTVTSVGSGITPWVLTRSTDLDTSAEMLRGIFMPVTQGATLAGSYFRLVTNGPITLNTTPLSFTAIAPTIAVEQY